jgi:hypothetical protein
MRPQAYDQLSSNVSLTCQACTIDARLQVYLCSGNSKALQSLRQECILCFMQVEKFDCDRLAYSAEFHHFSGPLVAGMNRTGQGL